MREFRSPEVTNAFGELLASYEALGKTADSRYKDRATDQISRACYNILKGWADDEYRKGQILVALAYGTGEPAVRKARLVEVYSVRDNLNAMKKAVEEEMTDAMAELWYDAQVSWAGDGKPEAPAEKETGT